MGQTTSRLGPLAAAFLAALTPCVGTGAELQASTEAATYLHKARDSREILANDFAGFRADLVVRLDGAEHQGTLLFGMPGRLELELGDMELRKRVKASLRSMLSHRMPSASSPDEKVAWGAQDGHPMGREVVFLEDKYDSRYRIRKNQILTVDRRMGDSRLLIHVLQTEQTHTGRYLPTRFSVMTFDLADGALKSSAVMEDSFHKLGESYVPRSRRVVSSGDGDVEILEIELRNPRLLSPGEADSE